MLKFLLAFLLLSTYSYSQEKNIEDLPSPSPKIILFGETHFVKEKYDEMKIFIFDIIDTIPSGQTVTMFFELPSSLNYALKKIKLEKDTTFFFEFFNHLYKKRTNDPSNFWTDYRDFIITLLEYSKSKEIELNLICIDIELEFRRTAFILSCIDKRINSEIDSLLNLDYIKNDLLTRYFLLEYIDELSQITKNTYEIELLKNLKHSILIDCTICQAREKFIFENFIEHYDSTDTMVFGTFGLDHIVNKYDFSAIGEFFKMNHKVDTLEYKPFYSLFEDSLRSRIMRVGILALNQEMKLSNMQKPNYYNHLMTIEEREYIEKLFNKEPVVRLNLSKHDNLNNLSSHFEYLIVYKSSNFR